MPTRSNQRLLAAAATGTLAIVSWTSYARPVIVPTHRTTAPRTTPGSFDRPAQVRLDALTGRASAIDGDGRNPFSAKPRHAANLPQTLPAVDREPPVVLREASSVQPTIAAPFKFMGTLQKRTGETWGVFADCSGYTRAAREGELVLGTWRVLRVGAESAFVESLDGRRMTLPLGGCGPRSS